MTPTRQRQLGFSLMELLIALMIIGVIATLGLKGLQKNTDKARYIQAGDKIRTLANGLDQYYLKHGKYPDMGSWDQMVDGGSPLVKENMIPVNMPKVDPWEQPFEGKSGKGTYELKCAGDPNDLEARKPFMMSPGQGVVELGAGGAVKPEGAAPDSGAAK